MPVSGCSSAWSQWLANESPLSGRNKSSGLQTNDKFFAAEFDNVIRHYLFALAKLHGPVNLYLTIGNQHFCLSPTAGHPFEFKNLKEFDRLL
jgi:hypothetical protein